MGDESYEVSASVKHYPNLPLTEVVVVVVVVVVVAAAVELTLRFFGCDLICKSDDDGLQLSMIDV
jgi:hypothetical protein